MGEERKGGARNGGVGGGVSIPLCSRKAVDSFDELLRDVSDSDDEKNSLACFPRLDFFFFGLLDF